MEASVAAVPGIIRDKPAAEPTFLGHPRGLALLFLVEMWERFSYYGMRALLVLYLVNALKWDTARASNLYGSYTSLAYITPLLGGYLADRFLGTRRSLVIGGILIACGHFSLALTGTATFYLGLALVIMGTGFFKPNVSTMVGQLYPEGDSRRDGGFTLFYMGINLGAFLAPLICGYLGERVGWHYGFGAAGVGMVLGLALYLWGRDKYLPGIGVGAPAARKLHVETSARSADDKKRVAALVIVVLFVVAFWSAFEQSGSSMNLFADKNTNRMVGSFLVPASWFQTVNAGFILLLAPLFAFMWRRLSSAGREPSTPMKMVFGLALLGIGFLFMVIGGRALLVAGRSFVRDESCAAQTCIGADGGMVPREWCREQDCGIARRAFGKHVARFFLHDLLRDLDDRGGSIILPGTSYQPAYRGRKTVAALSRQVGFHNDASIAGRLRMPATVSEVDHQPDREPNH